MTLQCLDFDWMFKSFFDNGTEKFNAEIVIDLLNNEQIDTDLFKQTSFRIFIDMMWRYYRKKIVYERFMPFLFYLITMNFTVIYGQELIDELKLIDSGDFEVKKFAKQSMYLIVVSCMILMQIYWVWNIIQEIKEILREGCNYLKDIWNYLDITISFIS